MIILWIKNTNFSEYRFLNGQEHICGDFQMHYCTFKGNKEKRLDVQSQIYKILPRNAFFLGIIFTNLIFAQYYLLQKIKFFNFNGWLGSPAVRFDFVKKNKNLFSHVILHVLFYKQHFFLTQRECCLTFLWTELQMLLRCCFIHMSIIILKDILYLVCLGPHLDIGLYVVSMWSIFNY